MTTYEDLVFVAEMDTERLASRLNISTEAAERVKDGAAGEALELEKEGGR